MELWNLISNFVQDNVVAAVAILALLVAYEALRIVRARQDKSP